MGFDMTRRDMITGSVSGLIAAASPALQSQRAEMKSTAQVESLIGDLLGQSGVPGVSIAVVERNELSYANGFGLADVLLDRPMRPTTIFQAASLTKPIFAHAVLKVCERQQIGLDTPLVSYVPHGRISNDSRAHRITARHVLAHMSGLPNWANGRRPLKLEFEPGAHFGYSGEAYNCLQEVVEKQTNANLNDLLIELVAQPLGMSESSFLWRDEYEWKAATGYEWDGTPVTSRSKPTEAMAASSLHTTASDFARFMIASLTRSEPVPEQLEYVNGRMMMSPQVRLSSALAWGLGWGLHLGEDGDLCWHFGDSRGYMSYAAMSRATGNGIVIFTNGRHGLRLCHAIAREMLPKQDAIFDWIYSVFYEGKLPVWPVY